MEALKLITTTQNYTRPSLWSAQTDTGSGKLNLPGRDFLEGVSAKSIDSRNCLHFHPPFLHFVPSPAVKPQFLARHHFIQI